MNFGIKLICFIPIGLAAMYWRVNMVNKTVEGEAIQDNDGPKDLAEAIKMIISFFI